MLTLLGATVVVVSVGVEVLVTSSAGLVVTGAVEVTSEVAGTVVVVVVATVSVVGTVTGWTVVVVVVTVASVAGGVTDAVAAGRVTACGAGVVIGWVEEALTGAEASEPLVVVDPEVVVEPVSAAMCGA